MAAPQASSRLELLQARFQQKQLQEKEQKLLQLYDQQQQRAYQVMQRGSAGSNGSNYGSSVSQHTVTKTTSSSHTTSTSQGGRVRQMFDERRHTTVKGIDRSYPLEPLENKPRKQTNGNAVQKNGNSTVNRHSVTVRRVARADMNSNLNGGKPIVSYHEDITRESFGPSGRQQPDDDDEVGNENHVVQFANGNHRDETHIEEVLDEDTIERNRMMAKLHLMEYDETLKHRIKNDLESEEFPEDFMVDVPDRLPKQSVPKKLSQAEARLERFRNANAKRNNATKNTSTIGVSRKRSDPIFPAKSTSSRQSKNKISKGSSIAKNGFENNESKDASVTPKYLDETQSTSESESTIKRRNYSPQFFSAESKKLATVSAINSKITGRSTPDFSKDPRSRSQSPKFFCKESEKSATTYAIDPKTYGKLSPEGLKNKQRRSESPKFFCKESKKSATTYAIDSKMLGKLSPEELKNRHRRSQNPKFFCTGAEKSTTTYTIDSKPAGRLSPDFSENKRLRSESPKFFCKESEKSATTYAIDKKTCGKLSPEELKNKQRRSESPKFFCKDSQINKKLYPEVSKNQQRTVVKIEPKCENVRRKSGKSLVIMDRTVDKYIKSPGPDKINRISSSPENPKNDIITRRKIENTVDVKPIRNGSTNLFERLTRERSASPQFIREESRTSMATTGMCTKECNIMSKPSDMIDKIAKKRSYSPEIMSPKQDSSSTHTTALKSPDFAKKILRKSTASPQFFSDRSATIMFVTPETITKTRTGYARTERKLRSPTSSISKSNINITNRNIGTNKKLSADAIDESSKYSIRNSVSRYFSEQCEKASESMDFSAKNDFQKTRTSRSLDQSRSSSPMSLKDTKSPSPPCYHKIPGKDGTVVNVDRSRSITPEFYCHETGKSATTVSLRPKTSKDSNERLGTTVSKKIESRNKSSKSPNTLILSKDATVICGSDRSTRHLSPNQQKLMNSRSKSPEFFCYETDKSATAVSLKPKHSQDFTERSKSPRATSVRSKSRSSKSSDIFTATKNIHISSGSSGSNSPALSQKITTKNRATPEFYCYETEKSATTVSLKPKPTKDSLNKHPGGPQITTVQLKDRSSKSPDTFTSSKNTEINASTGRSSHNSSPNPHSIAGRSGNPEFYCYETEKSATTISLKPKPTNGSLKERPRSPQTTTVQLKDRSSKSPDTFTSSKNTEVNASTGRSSHNSSPNPHSIAGRSGNPEFYCYETEKLATTVSLKPKPMKDSLKERSKSPRSSKFHSKNRSSKSPEFLIKDPKGTVRRVSSNVLRSTRLIRDVIRHQKNNQCNGASWKDMTPTGDVEGTSSVRGGELKTRSKLDEAGTPRANRNVHERATTPSPRRYELLAPESSPKSSTSVDVDAEIQEITMPDQNVKQKNLHRELRSTYTKSSKTKTSGSFRKSENVFAYSVHKPSKKRGSLLESDIFELSKRDQRPIDSTRKGKGVSLKQMTRNTSSMERSCSVSLSPMNESIFRNTKPRRSKEDILNEENSRESSRSRKQTLSPSKQAQALGSIELVRKIMNGEINVSSKTLKTQEDSSEDKFEKEERDSIVSVEMKYANDGSSNKNYERTDSVESALRRFDSICTDAGAGSFRGALGRSKESITEKRQTLEESRIEGSADDSRTISLKALDRSNVNFPWSPENKPSGRRSKKISTNAPEIMEGSRRGKASKPEEIRRRKKFAKAKGSIEIARIVRSESPGCKRKLFQDADSGEDTETGGSGSKRGDSTNTSARLLSKTTKSNKSELVESLKGSSKFLKPTAGHGSLMKKANKRGTDETSTGTSDSDHSLTVKQLRSIEDIRKSMESECSSSRGATGTSMSAIANNALRCSSTVRPRKSRVLNSDAYVESQKPVYLSRQSKNVSVRDNGLRDTESFVKSVTRFSRVVKSPSPDSTKATETSNRVRRNVRSSLSKSPDTVTRRPSTDLKALDTKSTKRPTPTKGTEPIANRKTATTTTTTTTRKSTDVVDGAILENGLHLRDQTAETKYDNDSQTTKKSDAFVIEFDEQAPKETDGPLPRKPLFKRPSTEKQAPSTQAGRPPSSVSSTSSGSSMQANISGSKSKMASKTRASNFSTSSRASALPKTGNACASDLLVPCKMCGRRFAQDRVILHEQICAKTAQKKRKQFDSVMFRVKGTELEKFVKKGVCKKQTEKPPEVKSNWRRKHEDFINAIRSAKQVQAHLAAGGKLSDLPPPPASDTSDYIQCPHCGRKFNKAAADRHIPKCEHMLHNKPIHSRAPKPRR
ncbi:PREDICTED: uncharacterized protein LOC107194628 [Dufourea novaeangliae]|uniref:uncharacterized protein LOC107194628 n=1 Tax=Dufourea novaeangliae TaxID=178035 RepID=UPI0007670507|nr:PREDICTED: uncharacterized protein LOC107194628 [Dufourea novaeangliae]